MSGNIAALASYNGTGTQGTAVVDSPEREGEIVSTIWNKNDTTRQLITGTAVKELTPGGIVSETLNNTVTTFTIGSDVDVIGEMYLHVYATSNEDFAGIGNFSNVSGNGSVSKIEILIGSQVWQTLTGFSIFANQQVSNQTTAIESLFGGGFAYNSGNGAGPPYTYNYILPLDGAFVNTSSPTRSNFSDQVNNGYLMAAASNQDMHIKVYWGSGLDIWMNSSNVPQLVSFKACKMFCRQTTLSNFEREKIRSMVLPKRVIMNQTTYQPVTLESGTRNYNFSINCDSFNIFAGALAIDLSIQMLSMNNVSGLSINTVELFLNGSSFSGPLTLEFLMNCGSFLNISKAFNTVLLFPLSDNLYGSGVPLNRFDSIRLVIKLVGANFDLASDMPDKLNVTAIGQSTILYSGGAASLNKY